MCCILIGLNIVDNVFSQYDLYGHALAQELLSGGDGIYNLGKPLVTITLPLVSHLCLGIEIFKEIIHFHYMATP